MKPWQLGRRQPWDGFLSPSSFGGAATFNPHGLNGKRVLITGAGGFIGSALVRALQACSLDRLVLLDVAEHGLYDLDGHDPESRHAVDPLLVVGNICDEKLMRELFEIHHPQLVFHMAALKHVPLMEINPLAAIETNVLGMHTVAEAAIAFGAERMVLLSTDKAVDPISIMGASKRLAELIVLANTSATKMTAVRLCNVLGSSGSVAPYFVQQIEQGKNLTVTHPDATRYFVSIADTVLLILLAATGSTEAKIVIPNLGPPTKITDLASFVIDRLAKTGKGRKVVYTHLRRGDKLHERMTSRRESVGTHHKNAVLLNVESPPMDLRRLDEVIGRIREAVHRRDRAELLALICAAVPEYMPDDHLQLSIRCAVREA